MTHKCLYLTGIYWGEICKMGSYDIRNSLGWEGRYSWIMHEYLMEENLASKYYLQTISGCCFDQGLSKYKICMHINITFLMKIVRTAVNSRT
jgi:hypothetical protein